jgi:hypothetical protein
MMSSRIDKSWQVLASYQTDDAARCVDIFRRPDDTFGFEEFRRDPEDLGAWTPVAYFSSRHYPSEFSAVEAARQAVPCVSPIIPDSRVHDADPH